MGSVCLNKVREQEFEKLLEGTCASLNAECKAKKKYSESKLFENRVREILHEKIDLKEIIPAAHPYEFPDISIGQYGVEVKFTLNDTWRSIGNSIFEGYKKDQVKKIYIIFGKMGGEPSVRWGRYDQCVMHVRTSHVPRFEIDLDAKESLFSKMNVSYEIFSKLNEDERMKYVRTYARKRLKQGERLWWLDENKDNIKTLPMQVRLFSNLESIEKLKLRAEASLLCPQIVGSSRNRTKYTDPIMYMLTYRGVLVSRDAFSAGSAAGPERGGSYVLKALKNIEQHMISAAQHLEDALFVEYWGENIKPKARLAYWLKKADHFAQLANLSWKPSKNLFRGLS